MSAFVGRRVPAAPVRVRQDALRVPLWLQLLWLLVKLALRLVLIVAGSPVLLGIAAAAVLAWAIWRAVGPTPLVCLVLLLVAGALALAHWSPARFARWLRLPLRSRWRRWSIYRWKWPATMDLADLNKRRDDGTAYAPRLLTVRSTAHGDAVRARMLAGQTLADWAKVSDRLAQTFGALDCRVRAVPGRPHEVEAWFLVNDPLTTVVQPHDHRGSVQLDSVAVGLREDGEVYRLPLLGHHVLLCGATGAGKSAVEWAIVDQLEPAIAAGLVELYGIDPKAMELGAGEPLFARMAYESPEAYAEALEAAVATMHRRRKVLRGVTRQHQPTPAEPLVVVLVDELAALSYITERDLKRRIDAALGLLLSQGRAVGVSVVGSVQDPRKEVVAQRDLYPVRVALRLTEADQVQLVLGPGARDRGARSDLIPESLPGVAFVLIDGHAEPVRVRFAWVSDEHIATLCAAPRPPRLSVVSGDPDAVAGPTAAPEAA